MFDACAAPRALRQREQWQLWQRNGVALDDERDPAAQAAPARRAAVGETGT